MEAEASLRLGTIVIAPKNFDKMYGFWKEALHYVPKYPPEDGWALLTDPKKKGPNVSIDSNSESGRSIGKIHLDLYASKMDAEVKRLIKLGAKLHRPKGAGEKYTVMEDPEGNLFCIIQITASSY